MLYALVGWLAQADVQQGFAEYGAVGLIAIVALGAAGYLFRQLLAAMRREQARADAAEAEVRRLNQFMTEKLISQLTTTADTVSRAAEMLAVQRRDEHKGGR